MRSAILLAAALAASGCAHQEAGPVQPPVPPPHLAVGDTFAFDDGRMERVTALSAGTVQWHGQDDFAYTTFVDVLAPRIAWHGGTVRGERRFAASPTSIFPLSAGRVVVFDAERRLADSGTGVATTVAETWSCRTNGTARIATPAGAFDTFRVDCTLTTQPLTPALTRSFYYAPAVNYFVRRDDETENGTVTSISLTGFATAEPALPAETERLRSAARQSALESTPSGQALPWRDDVGGMSGTVRPTRTMQSSHRGWCRSYAEEIEANARRYRFERLACRVGNKAWQPVAG